MSSLTKIEEILKVLGYSCEEDVTAFEIEGNKCKVTFSIKRNLEDSTDDGKMALEDFIKSPLYKLTENNLISNEQNKMPKKLWKKDPLKLDSTPLVPEDLVEPIDISNSNKVIVTKPRTVLRYLFFKSRDKAVGFAHKHESKFEICSTQALGKGETDLDIYKVKKNKVDNDLYQKGYGRILEFRMNGVDFDILEKEEDLKKKIKKGAGGPCIRYKE